MMTILRTFLSIFLLLAYGSAMGTSEFKDEEAREIKRLEKVWFDKKDETFWVLKNREAFIQASHNLIDENGKWLGSQPAPAYVKYTSGKFKEEDIKLLEKWLKLDTLKCFSLAEENRSGPISIIDNWATSLQEQGIDLQKKGVYKIAWLKYATTLYHHENGRAAPIATEWIKTNLDFQMKNSHYRNHGVQAH